ncbi:hypothetical protein [Promicromonospora sp. NPDC057488]|uniref:hypothetical protein n=1 Tax=Promicromonospora sp. NPDC057488 TaxID=3346147 RepID=UPI00366EA259
MPDAARLTCPFCHRKVSPPALRLHEWWHGRRRRDGQQQGHVTLTRDARYEGSLDGVPQTYRHSVCGAGTGMPEEIVRSYLANPFLYGDLSFCTGCGDYVSKAELRWAETGQPLREYFDALRAAATPELRAQAQVHRRGGVGR